MKGLDWEKFKGDIGATLSQEAKAGAHELASALFRGDAFVMYPRADNAKEDSQEKGGMAELRGSGPELAQGMSRGGLEM